MRTSVTSLTKKFISTFFAVTLALGLIPVAAFAVEDNGAAVPKSAESANADSLDIENLVIPSDSEESAPIEQNEGEALTNSSGEDGTIDNGAGSENISILAANERINEDMVLTTRTVAQAESTRSYFLAQTLESTRTVPIVSANLPLDTGATDVVEPVEGDGQSGEDESGEDSDESDLVSAPIAAESIVVGSFEYRGITYAVEPGGESVAVVAADYSKLPEEFIDNQVIVLPSMVTSDGMDFYTVSRIADNAFANLTSEVASQHVISSGVAEGDAVEKSALLIEDREADTVSREDAETTDDETVGITAVAIPASVTSIGDDAFTGADTLQYVVVSEDNPTYSSYDGALYDADQTRLLLIPEGRLGAVRIAPSVTELDPEVFSHCPSVDTLVADADSAAYQLLSENDLNLSLSELSNSYESDYLNIQERCLRMLEEKSMNEELGLNNRGLVLDENLNYFAAAYSSCLVANGGVLHSQLTGADYPNLTHSSPVFYWSFSNNGYTIQGLNSAWGVIDTVTLAPRENCTLIGWSKDSANPSNAFLVGNLSFDTTEYVWANWKVKLTWNPSGGYWGTNTSATGVQTSNNNNNTKATSYDNSTLPNRTGYTFKGWSTNSAATSGSTSITVPNSPTTYYAIWTPHNYTIKFSSEADGVTAPADIPTKYDATVVLPALERPGYTFKGWDTAQDGSGTRYSAGTYAKFNLTSADAMQVPLYAQWELDEYTLSFSSNIGDTGPVERTRTYFDELPALRDVGVATGDTDGFKFAGYFDATGKQYYGADGTRLVNMANTKGNVALYAHWKYRIFFDKNDDDAKASLDAEELEDGSFKVTLTGGTGSESVFIYDYDSSAPYIWATWHGKAAASTYPTVYLPGASRANYPSDGSAAQSFGPLSLWTYDGGTKSIAAGAALADQNALIGSLTDDAVGKCITLKADWKNAAVKYTVRLVAASSFPGADGIDPIASVTVTNEASRIKELSQVPYGSPLTEGATAFPITVPVPEPSQHVKFAGYYAIKEATERDTQYIDAQGRATSQVLDRATLTNGAVELYARWVVAAYDITFELTDADAGQDNKKPSGMNLRYDEDVPDLSWSDGGAANTKVPERVGFEFRGFFDKDGVQYYDRELNVLDGAKWTSAYDATTLYARWTYAVDFDMNLGDAGSAKANDAVRTKSGSAWLKEQGSVSPVFAVEATEYTKSGVYDAFSLTDEVTTAAGDAKRNIVPTDLVRMRGADRTGYAFKGFTTVKGDATTLVDAAWLADQANLASLRPQSGANTTLYALWEALPYTVTFDFRFADYDTSVLQTAAGSPSVYAATAAAPIRYDEPIPSSFAGTAPDIEGYTFEGYGTASDGSGTTYFVPRTDGTVVPATAGGATLRWTEPLAADGTASVTLYARYTMTAHAISFDVTGGYTTGYADGWDPSTYTSYVNLNAALLPPGHANDFAVPERYGYTFAGWFSGKGGTGTRYSDANGAPTNDKWTRDADGTVYAAWTPKTYTVEWMYNYAQGGVDAGVFHTVTSQTFDAPLTMPAGTPSRPGYSTFDGWFTAATGGEQVSNQTSFHAEGLEDRAGNLMGGGIGRYYARYTGAEEYWVKLLAGEGGRFTGAASDSAHMPIDSWYAYSLTANVKEYPIRADVIDTVQLNTPDENNQVSPLRARLTDYSFAGWREVTDSLAADNGNKSEYKPISETHASAVYATDTTLPNGEKRLAGTLKDDMIPAEVMGNRTFVACWTSAPARIVLQLGRTSTDGEANVDAPAFDATVASSLGFTASGTSMAKDWASPYDAIDLTKVATCAGYRLAGFVRQGHENDADAATKAVTELSAARESSEPSDIAGTYVAVWEALPYTVVFHANYRGAGVDSASYDTTETYVYDAEVELPYPGPSFPIVDADGSYASYSFDYWGPRQVVTNAAVVRDWRADEKVALYDILALLASRNIAVTDRTVHLYAQWVSTVNVTVPLFVSLAVDTDSDWADVVVADWDGKNGDDTAFLGLQSTNATPFQVHSVTCEVINEFGTGALVTDAGRDSLSTGNLFLTVQSGRANGRTFEFDLGESGATFKDGEHFDAATDGLRVTAADARIPLKFGLKYASGKKVTDFDFADGLVVDDMTSKGNLARIFYTIEAVR